MIPKNRWNWQLGNTEISIILLAKPIILWEEDEIMFSL